MNIVAKIENKNLIIEIPVNEKPIPSVSGKTLIVADTRGRIETDIEIDGKRMILMVSAYIPK